MRSDPLKKNSECLESVFLKVEKKNLQLWDRTFPSKLIPICREIQLFVLSTHTRGLYDSGQSDTCKVRVTSLIARVTSTVYVWFYGGLHDLTFFYTSQNRYLWICHNKEWQLLQSMFQYDLLLGQRPILRGQSSRVYLLVWQSEHDDHNYCKLTSLDITFHRVGRGWHWQHGLWWCPH